MRPIRYATKELVRAFDARKVLDLAQVKAAPGYAGEDDGAAQTARAGLSQQLFPCGPVLHPGAHCTLGWSWVVGLLRASGFHATVLWWKRSRSWWTSAAGGWVSTELEDVLGVRVQAALLSLVSPGSGAAPPDRRRVPVRLGATADRRNWRIARSKYRPKRSALMGLGSGGRPASPPAGLSGDPQRKAAASVCRVRVAASGSRRRHHRRGLDRAQRQDRGSGTAGIAQRWRFHRSRPRRGSRATGI